MSYGHTIFVENVFVYVNRRVKTERSSRGKHWGKMTEYSCMWMALKWCFESRRLFLPYFFSCLLFPLMLRGHVDIECQLVFSTLAALTVTHFIINIVNTHLFINSAAACAWLTNALCTFNRYLSLMLWNYIRGSRGLMVRESDL